MADEESTSSGMGAAAERLRRLQQLGVHRGRAGLASPPAAPSPRPPSAAPPASGSSPRLAGRVGAEELITPAGSCLVAAMAYSLEELRGGWALGAARAVRGAAVAACSRDPRLADFDFRGAAFLDTETSGLAGGAGTFAFMVGIGMFEGESYVVRQLFMRSPAEERALLHALSGLLARCSGLVTFNGRSFDAPLLNTRYALQRQPSPLADLPHLDLLPAARQRWRLRLPSCALGALEQEILGWQRSQQDVPGWLIPSIYQEYARSQGQPRPEVVDDMARVFYHNREDIVNMAPLAAILCAPFEETGAWRPDDSLPAADWLSIGRCYEELDWQEASERAYRRALEAALPAELRGLALRRLGWLLKRQERRAEAVAVWHDWITSVSGPEVTPYEELAKHHEWQEVDLAAARKWTMWGLHTARQLPPGPAREEALSSLQHRLERLERKLAGTG
jgi:uncharacterized protein YprB with RNaseH-like and TPR domain